jgi:NADH dehydrogenase (ubiquinone) Fe-S protein 1
VLLFYSYSFQPGQNSVADRREARFVYLLGADEFKAEDFHPDAFIVYQGHHGKRFP